MSGKTAPERFQAPISDFPGIAGDEAVPDQELILKCSIEELTEAMRRLSDADRDVLMMKYFLEYGDAEIAVSAGIKPSSVRSRLSRARGRVYEIMREMTEHE